MTTPKTATTPETAAVVDPLGLSAALVRPNALAGTLAGRPGVPTADASPDPARENAPESEPSSLTDGVVCETLCERVPETAPDPVPLSAETGTDGRDHRGRFVRANGIGPRFTEGNSARLVHGLRSRDYRARLLSEARAALAEKRTSIEADLGGPDALSTVRRDAVERLLEADVMAQSLANELLVKGLFTPRGKTRAAFGAFLQLLDRWQRLAVLVGLERRPRRIASLDDVARDILARRAERPVEASTASDDANVDPAAVDLTTSRAAATEGA